MEIHLIPDKSALIQLPIFLSVLFGLSYFIFKPITKIITARREKSNKLLENIKEIEERIKVSTDKYASLFEKAREDAHKEKEKIRQLGLSEESAIKTKARKEASLIISKAKAEILESQNKVLSELKANVPAMAEDIIKKIK
ncbi:MAG: ATP synthase F0 subunit B [Deltaproteobacteria bacterium]|nr:ATP synthase F0 subunit B [Deltaproteobacteria bacterium]